MNSMHAFLVFNYVSFIIKAAKISQVKANYKCFKTQIGYEILGEEYQSCINWIILRRIYPLTCND